MKKKNILNLIKYHIENNDAAFKEEACEIAKDFDTNGDDQLAAYIVSLISNTNAFVPQLHADGVSFFKQVSTNTPPLPLPDSIKDDVIGIVNAIGHNAGVNKFLFEGEPGTGKTETAKQVSRILGRDLFVVNFDTIIDSKLGQTSKNISSLFKEIANFSFPEKLVILFDELDAIAIDRINSNDIREMGRATSAILKGLDGLNDKIVLIATTNLFKSFDRALIRRFDAVVNFNRYNRDDLIEISKYILNEYLLKFKLLGRNIRLFEKIIALFDPLPYPGDLKNIIKSAVAFSNPSNEYDYLRRLLSYITKKKDFDLKELQKKGFTLREIEILTGVSKSQVARETKENLDE